MSRPLPPLVRALLLCAASLVLGLHLTSVQPWLPWPACTLFVFAVVVGLRRQPTPAVLPSLVPWAAVVSAGVLLGAGAAARVRHDCRWSLPDGKEIQVVGVLVAEPTAEGSTTLRMSAPCRGDVRVRSHGPLPAAGIRLRATGRWLARPPLGRLLPDPRSAGSLVLRRVRVDRGVPVFPHPLLRLRGAAQRRIRTLFGPRSATLEALLLARTESLEPETRDRFTAAGLAHVLAISGLHVGVVAGVLLTVARALRLPATLAAGGAAAGTVGYVLLLGAPYAACRAALQVVLLLVARLLQRPSDPLALLAAAALVLLAIDPLAIAEPGFQLSFAGAAALAMLRRPVLARLPRRLPSVLREGLAAGMAAGLVTMPIAAVHFGRAAPVGLVSTLVAVPIVALLVPAAGCALVASMASPSFGRFLAGAAGLGVDALQRVTAAAAALPFGHSAVTGPVAWGWLLATGGGLWLLGLRRLRKGAPSLVASVAFLAVLVAWPPLAERYAARGALRITAIDVGQGDALAIRTPHGRWLLVDAGPRSPTFDAGRSRVVPFLLRQGAKRLDLLVITHPDADHVGGAAAVVAALRVGGVLDPGVAAGRKQLVQVLREAAARGTRWYRSVPGGRVTVDGVRLELLAPAADDLEDVDDANDYSVVFRLVYGRFSALFEGDAPESVEREVIERAGGRLSATLLKVGHHGSRTSTSEVLLDASEPSIALISVGRRNRYGHPSPEVLERLRLHSVEIHRTDREGTITVSAWSDGHYTVEHR